MLSPSDFLSTSTPKHLTVDNRAWLVREENKDKPGFDMHRYQTITVRRDGMEYDYTKELGPAILWPHAGPGFQFWAANEYSVGEVMEISERLREGKPPEQREPTNLIEKYREQEEEKRALRAHRSVSGPHISIGRN